jgi:hypothetical protein
MLASRARHVARDLVTRAIAAPMAALASAPALDAVAATARDRTRGADFGVGSTEAWAPRVSPRDGSERAGSVSPSARALLADTRTTPSAPRWPRRRAPFQPWRVDPAPPSRGLTVRELQAQLRFSERARKAWDSPEYGGDFSGEDEDAWQDALGAAIRAIALEDGPGTGPSSVRAPAAAEEDADAHAAEAFFTRAVAFARRAAPAFFPAFGNPENEGFAAASVKLKRVKKMNKHKHRKRRKRDRNKTK